MVICIDFSFLKEISSTDLLTYLALIIAYLAYSYTINRDLESWRSLLISFRSDLKSQGAWIGGKGYSQETYKDKKSYSPFKIIYPLSFESLPEIIRRGVKELPGISDEFIENLSLFNERIMAFNSALDHIKKIVSFNPIISEKLNKKLSELGIKELNEEVDFDFFKKEIQELKKKESIFHLAENVRRLHRVVHVEIIGNSDRNDTLNYLYHKITGEIESALNNFDKRKPFFVRCQEVIIVISLVAFFLIEIFLKK